MEKNYNSPIELIYCDIIAKTEGDMETKTEDAILETIRKIGINIDKSALIEALTQDRVRYEKAYRSGYDARDSEIVRCAVCKQWDVEQGRMGRGWCGVRMCMTRPEWFCWDGEREELTDDTP